MNVIKLGKYFTLNEFIISETAINHGIDNTPDGDIIAKLKELCENVLDPLREAIGYPIHISSGYRCEALNKLIGGTATSQHVKGEAADIKVDKMTIEEAFRFIKGSGIVVDQCIQEKSVWIHISFREGRNRNEYLRMKIVDGKPTYSPA